MAIEIRELHIKAVVGTTTGQGSSDSARTYDEDERESLIAMCVERVMEVLAREKER